MKPYTKLERTKDLLDRIQEPEFHPYTYPYALENGMGSLYFMFVIRRTEYSVTEKDDNDKLYVSYWGLSATGEEELLGVFDKPEEVVEKIMGDFRKRPRRYL